MAFATVMTLACGVLFGLAPAFQARRLVIADSLKEGARSAAGGITTLRRFGAQQLLVVCEVALALMLLVGGGLMLRSLQRQLAVEPGFRANGVVTAQISLPRQYSRRGARPTSPAGWSNACAHSRRSGPSPSGRTFRSTVTPARRHLHRRRDGHAHSLTTAIASRRTTSRRSASRYFAAVRSAPADRDSTPLVVVITERWRAATGRTPTPSAGAFDSAMRPAPKRPIVGVVATARFRDLTSSVIAPTQRTRCLPVVRRSDRTSILRWSCGRRTSRLR